MTTQVTNDMLAFDGGAMTFRNKILNGNFGVNQRAVSGTVTLAAGAYGHDRWKAGASGCTYTFSTTNNVTTITISAGTLMQVIEGLNLQSGTHVLSWTGTATARVDSGSYGASGLTGTAVGGTNQTIEFSTGTVSKVQYEPGSTVTPFEFRPYGAELALCQRYYETSTRCDIVGTGNGYLGGTQYFKVSKRTAPASISTSITGGSGYTGFVTDIISTDSFRAYATANGGSGTPSNVSFSWTASAEL